MVMKRNMEFLKYHDLGNPNIEVRVIEFIKGTWDGGTFEKFIFHTGERKIVVYEEVFARVNLKNFLVEFFLEVSRMASVKARRVLYSK